MQQLLFIFRNGFTLHVSGDDLTHHQEAPQWLYCTCFGSRSHPLSGGSVMALLYMFRVTIAPIIRSLRNGFTLHVSGDNLTHHQESPQWLYSTCFGWQSHPSSGGSAMALLYMFRVTISPIIRIKRNYCILLDLFYYCKAWCSEPQILNPVSQLRIRNREWPV